MWIISTLVWVYKVERESMSQNYAQVPDFERREGENTFVLDRSDPVAMIEAREQRVRERFVAIEEAKILRDQVRQCYYKEGVNHYQNCREIVQTYLKKIGAHDFGAPGAR